ncbi:MAG: hypothetical protein K0U12_07780 [Gammaproteobacteria bacterium]|nr:hypothetical protein [Gammaproteobacteria bacterium]
MTRALVKEEVPLKVTVFGGVEISESTKDGGDAAVRIEKVDEATSLASTSTFDGYGVGDADSNPGKRCKTAALSALSAIDSFFQISWHINLVAIKKSPYQAAVKGALFFAAAFLATYFAATALGTNTADILEPIPPCVNDDPPCLDPQGREDLMHDRDVMYIFPTQVAVHVATLIFLLHGVVRQGGLFAYRLKQTYQANDTVGKAVGVGAAVGASVGLAAGITTGVVSIASSPIVTAALGLASLVVGAGLGVAAGLTVAKTCLPSEYEKIEDDGDRYAKQLNLPGPFKFDPKGIVTIPVAKLYQLTLSVVDHAPTVAGFAFMQVFLPWWSITATGTSLALPGSWSSYENLVGLRNGLLAWGSVNVFRGFDQTQPEADITTGKLHVEEHAPSFL